MIKLRGPYKTRSVRFLRLVKHKGWQIKVYGIRYQDGSAESEPDPSIVQLAQEAVLPHLPEPAIDENRHGIGFLIVHQGQDRNWLLLDWWYDQEILKQHLFSSPLNDPAVITRAEDDLLACTWELTVHEFERKAWIETVLKNHESPDVEAYLSSRLNADL